MKPGKPLTVARRGSCVVLGLPGNPASASLTFALFGVPLLRAMQGETNVRPLTTRMAVVGRHTREPGRTEFLRARSHFDAGVECAKLEPNQASGAVTSFARAELLVRVPAERGAVESGDSLEVIRIDDVFAS
jgi:molybdopterin molybdotransferase